MKWFAGTLGGVFLGLLGLCVFIVFYSGYFKPVEVTISTETPLGPFKLLYKEVVGPYHTISEHLLQVENFAKAQGIPCPRTFGRFLDDPQSIDHERLRSEVGCLFDESIDLNAFMNQEEFSKLQLKTNEFKFASYIMGVFQGSPAIVTFKVYPKIIKTAAEKRLRLAEQSFEIYEIHGGKDMTTKVVFEILP